ncbi:MAG: ABC transporter substrate-binding protein, partial [Defluviitaleaceae bacterium]|nr:ABC transporter substrate-binding protein [Defluviitaleaceae bacterium]
MKVLTAILTAILFVIFFTGCGDVTARISPDGLPYAPAVEEQEDDGIEPEQEPELEMEQEPVINPTTAETNTLRLHMRPPATLNPLLNEDVTVARILRLIFEPLAMLDDEIRINGHLAQLDFASDFAGVHATIREGAIWSDGRPVVADDIVFSVEFLKNAPENAVYRANVENIASVQRVDARTAQITFTNATVMAGYSLNFPIIPQHIFYGETNPQSFANMNPVGNGMFLLKNHSPMRSLTLQRNPSGFRRRAQINEIEVVFLPDTATDFYAFERGRIDAIHLPLTEWTRNRGVRSPVYETFPAMYFEFIGFNPQGFWGNIHNRMGVAHAFNADEAVAGLYLAHAVRSVAPIHPQSWAASRVPGPAYDPSRAAALLAPIRQNEPLVILANAENPQRVSIAQQLAASLTAAELPAIAEILPFEEYSARLDALDFDLFIGGIQLSFAPDVSVFFSGGLFPHDPVLEAAYSALLIASSELAYLQAISRLQQAFAERLPVIGLAFKHSAILANPRITSALNPAPDH